MSLYNNSINQYAIGKAYIALPSDIDRAVYLRDCYMNNQVSIITEDGGFLNRVPISNNDLNFAIFPTDPKTLGSLVVYGVEEASQQPIILKVLQSRQELGDGKEHQFKFKRMLEGSTVEISGSSKDGVINLIVNGSKVSGINLKVLSAEDQGAINLDVAGRVFVTASNGVEFEQQGSFKSTTVDEESDDSASFEQSSTENKFYNKKLVVNDGDNPLALGKELKDLLSDFITEVGNITVVTALGVQPIINKPQILALKQKLDGILSKVVFTDK